MTSLEVTINLDLQMAEILGQFIVANNPDNPAIKALGQQLLKISDEEIHGNAAI